MDPNPDTNKAMIRRFVEEVKNKRQYHLIDEIFSSDYVEHNTVVAGFGGGTAGYVNFLKHLFNAFPEDSVTIENILVEGDLAAYRGTESGTHKDVFLGIPATGKSATWTEIQFFRIQNGKVVEHWVDVDLFAWFTQLGVIPPMGG